MNKLVKWDEIECQIVEAKDLKTIVQMQEQIEILKIIAKQTDGSLKEQNRCSKYRIILERKAGRIYSELPDEKDGRPKKSSTGLTTFTSKQQAEKETKKSRETLNKWAKESEIDEEVLEEYEAECNDKEKELTSSGFIKKIEKKKAQKVELPQGKYDVIYIDPPWRYDFAPTTNISIDVKHYPTLVLEEIINYKDKKGKLIIDLFYKDSVIFLWATNPKLNEALELMKEWEFIYKTNFCWDKVKPIARGMGYWSLGQHELLLVGTKGEFSPPENSKKVPSLFSIEKTTHSRKPEYVYELIENYFPDHKYLELFSTKKRRRWTSWGDKM